MTKKIMMANWKMHGSSKMLNDYMQVFMNEALPSNVDIAFFPPFSYLHALAGLLSGSVINMGAQNVSDQASGAYTGEISVSMLKDLGCAYAIVGHSERRQYYHETNELVAQKALKVVGSGLTPIVCIGESLAIREAGDTEKIIDEQLEAVLNVMAEDFSGAIIAYEPIWAIGTGVSATTSQIGDVHAFLREKLDNWHKRVAKSIRIVYGGSVKTDNAAQIFAIEHVDGALVGGASLDPTSFAGICQAARD